MKHVPTKQEMRHYIAAIIDAEGHVSDRGGSASVQIANTDIDILDTIEMMLNKLGIHYTRRAISSRQPHHKQAYLISICKKDDIAKLLHFPIASKRKVLIIKKIADNRTHRYIEWDDSDLIARRISGQTLKEIAQAYNTTTSAVHYHITKINNKRNI